MSAAEQEIPKHYDPHAAWQKYYGQWEEQGLFKGDPAATGPSYSVVIPPPNVTGSLHMGHALNNTLQDILVRYRRMCGDNVVWIPGTDHASIAVHWVIERQLRAEGTDRQALGREAFLERAWQFKEQAGDTILNQLRRLGVSCDWSRQRFTMDEGLNKAVREAFVRLYQDGLIYRAEQLVNWDPVSQTTLSDLEVVHEEGVKGELWSFAYPLASGDGEIVVATTRPETMLGDTAVAVHPEDPRYKALIGQNVRHPVLGREIPIIADPILVDPEFGTGAVKITPAHDFNDFEVGKRHNLPMINMLNKDGTVNAEGGPFAGLDRAKARTAVKERLEELGLDRGTQEHKMNIGRSERSGTIVEPMLSTQWYVRARPLASPALAAVENDFMRFVPKQWENTYYAWLRNIRDWCISRQLWWGHQIPAWYCDSCKHVNVAREAPETCEACGGEALTQDDDVLDTWFSSALWPFSTMGWPNASPDLQKWYPTSVLITGFDIIFFWVARMMMMGQYFMGHVPFKDVYIHALIRDAKGEKMSKTKGNVIDPLEMIEKFGCDAFRFTLAAFAAQGRDVRWDEKRALGYQKFCNKIWQAFRFTLSNLEAAGYDDGAKLPDMAAPSPYDYWIRGRLAVAQRRVEDGLATYKFNDAAAAIYSFVWDELCDWYLELAKVTLYSDEASQSAKDTTLRTLVDVFDGVIRMLHPFMPLMSEELWQRLPGTQGSVMEQAYPQVPSSDEQEAATAAVEAMKAVVVAVRRVRAEYRIAPKEQVAVLVRADDATLDLLDTHRGAVLSLAKATWTPLEGAAPAKAAVEVVGGNVEVLVPLEGLVDFDAEVARLKKELTKLDGEVARVKKQLGNQDFVERAPAEIIEEKRHQLTQANDRQTRLNAALERLTA